MLGLRCLYSGDSFIFYSSCAQFLQETMVTRKEMVLTTLFPTRKTVLWHVMLWGGLLNLVFIAVVLLGHPSLLGAHSLSTVIFCIILLVVYICIGVTLPLQAG